MAPQITQNSGSTEWMSERLCNDQPNALFFPTDAAGAAAAKRICNKCVVVEECLEYALRNRIDQGVWGGKSQRERRAILKQRRDLAKN